MRQIFFVNSKSTDGLDNQRMRSHAALVANRQRRLHRLNTANLKRDDSGESSDTILPSPPLSASATASRSVSPDSKSTTPTWESGTREQDQRLAEELALTHLARASRVGELAPPLALGMYAAAATTQGKNYFSFYLEDAVPLSRVIYNPFNVSGVFRPELIETLVTNVLYHAFAAVSQGMMDHGQHPESAPSYDMLQHKGQALMNLRNYLNTEQRPCSPAIIAIAFLAMLEQSSGNTIAYKVHREVLGNMVAATGGFDALEPDARFVVCEFEMMWAIQSGYTVIKYKPHNKARHRWTDTTTLQSAGIPDGFWALALEGKISGQTMDTVTHVMATHKSDRSSGAYRRARSDPRSKRKPFTDWWDAFPCFHINYNKELEFEELLEVALLQFCLHRVKPSGPCVPSLNFVSRDRLTLYLPAFALRTSILTTPEREGLVWIMMVTLYAWRAPGHELLSEGKELRRRARQYPFIAKMRWTAIEEICRKFLWAGDFLLFCKSQWENG